MMSGAVSYELFAERMGSGNIGFTPEGGIFQTFVNNTGNSVKGTIVVASTSVDNAVDIAPGDSPMPIGIIYENGISNGNPVKVVTSGKAAVLLKDDEPAARGNWCGVSDITGRMMQKATAPSTTEHYREIGHSLENKNSGTDVLALVSLHFN